jgi:type II secretory pathway component PulJ
MIHFRINNRGVTLIEQLAALMLGAVMMTSLYGYFRSELYHLRSVESKTNTMEDARGALDIMIRDLKNAGSWGTGSAPTEVGGIDDPDHDADTACNRVYAATASIIHVQMDLNSNGNCADLEPRENIRYELAGPTSTCPGSNSLRRNGDCLVANVVTTGGKLFTYYDDAGNDLGNSPNRDAVRRVGVAFAVQVKDPDPRNNSNLATWLSSSVEFRN